MGPIVVMVRRPSLHIPVPPEDVQDEAGFIQTIARISSFQSEMAGTAVLQGDPPQWVVQVVFLYNASIVSVPCGHIDALLSTRWLCFLLCDCLHLRINNDCHDLWFMAGSGARAEAETGAEPVQF